MNLYIKLDESGNPVNHPMLEDNIRLLIAQNSSIPYDDVTEEVVLSNGYAKYERTQLSPGQYVTNDDNITYIKHDDGVVRPLLEIIEMTQDEKIHNWVRLPRNWMLDKTDWTVMPDSPLSEEKKAQWSSYRQHLRDITNSYMNVQNPLDIDWPVDPNGESPMSNKPPSGE